MTYARAFRTLGVVALAVVFIVAGAPRVIFAQTADAAALTLEALNVLEEEYVDPVRPVPLLNAALAELRADTHLSTSVVPDIPTGTSEGIARTWFQREFAIVADRSQAAGIDLAEAATAAMLASLHDSHTSYYTPETLKEIEAEMRHETSFTGIGITVGQVTDRAGTKWVMVTEVYPGSPAETSGIRRFDVIQSVDGHEIGDADLGTAAQLIRGPAGSSVTLLLRRAGETLTASPTRGPVRIEPAWASVLGSGIGYLRIAAFTADSATITGRALQSLGPIPGLVIDLRGNPGGIVTEVQSVAGLFVPAGTVIGRVHGHGTEGEAMRATGLGGATNVPIVVLTDGGTASAAEILTGGLRDARRATIVGERTAGALGGSVTIKLGYGGMSVTVERIQGPRDEVVEGRGIAPDIPVRLTGDDVEAGRDSQLHAAESVIASQHPAVDPAPRFRRGDLVSPAPIAAAAHRSLAVQLWRRDARSATQLVVQHCQSSEKARALRQGRQESRCSYERSSGPI
ncbi:MAG TPA: S41 family peptidase [bacterium]|nr:S41 family peptidase [bacterium]